MRSNGSNEKLAQIQANGKLEPAQTADESGCECISAFFCVFLIVPLCWCNNKKWVKFNCTASVPKLF